MALVAEASRPGAPAAPSPGARSSGSPNRSHLTPPAAAIIGAGLLVLGFGFYALNILLFVVGLLTVGFVALEYLIFTWGTRGFGAHWFATRREGLLPRVDTQGTASAGLLLSHRGPRGLYAEIFDLHPSEFQMQAGSPRLRTYLAPGEDCRLFYVFTPTSRGVYSVGPTTVVAHDALGIAFRTAELDTRSTLFVTPARPILGAGASYARLSTRFLGAQALRRRGYGTEFRSLREYLPTDDYRSIAWKRSTRGKLFVREFEQENRQEFLVLIDASASMSVGLPGEAVLDKVVEAVQTLAAYVARREDRIGLLAWASGPTTYLPPGRGPSHLTALARALAGVQAQSRPFQGGAALDFLRQQLPTRTHVMLFTTFFDPSDPFRLAYRRFSAKGHRLYAFTPSVVSFYPPAASRVEQTALSLATELDGRRAHDSLQAVRALGVPTFAFERSGAVDPVVALYSSLRAWGYAR